MRYASDSFFFFFFLSTGEMLYMKEDEDGRVGT